MHAQLPCTSQAVQSLSRLPEIPCSKVSQNSLSGGGDVSGKMLVSQCPTRDSGQEKGLGDLDAGRRPTLATVSQSQPGKPVPTVLQGSGDLAL